MEHVQWVHRKYNITKPHYLDLNYSSLSPFGWFWFDWLILKRTLWMRLMDWCSFHWILTFFLVKKITSKAIFTNCYQSALSLTSLIQSMVVLDHLVPIIKLRHVSYKLTNVDWTEMMSLREELMRVDCGR